MANLASADACESVSERFESHPEVFGIKCAGIDLYLLRDFLSKDECKVMTGLIDENNHPSRVMGNQHDSGFRTSHSSPLGWSKHPLVDAVNERISILTGIDCCFQEGMEGQRYEIGQEFKPHFDTFSNDQAYWPEQERVGGQRTWTVMICLNQPLAGGGTLFPVAGARLKPRTGNLLAWNNLEANGRVNPAALHCGEPVEAGVKYILTKWHRERPFRPEFRLALADQE